MREHKERIEINDSVTDILVKLSEGNPGALRAMMEMVKEAPLIDPDSAWGAFGPLIALDGLGLYGPAIWMLYKDACGHSVLKAETLFRAHQLGIISGDTVRNAHVNKPDFDALLARVQERLPAFGQPQPENMKTAAA